MTAYNGQAITYDEIGNPTSYYDGYRYTLTWERGRQLKSVTYSGDTTTYEYNADGIRVRKNHPDGSYDLFHVLGGTIVGETRYGSDGKVDLWLRYNMDAGGSICGISLWYDGDTAWTDYYFVKNLQGDVLEVRKCSDNTVAARYTYDAWGNILTKSGSLADTNPFRYRTYYYDSETWFYYLQSRYYDPAIGRFLNADAFASTGQGLLGNNMFAYCQNDPVNFIDPDGERIVGIGIQGEVQGGNTSIGFEIVIYFDPDVCNEADYLIVAYTYSGAEISLMQLYDVIERIDAFALMYLAENQDADQDALMALARMAMNGAGFSGGFFVIDGYDNFDDPEDYSGAFETWSVSATHSSLDGAVYYSYSPTCQAVGIKFGMSFSGFNKDRFFPINLSYSRTMYSDPIILMEGHL